MSLEYVGTAGLVYLVLFTAVIPVVVLRSVPRQRTRPFPPASAMYRSVLVQQGVILGVSLLAARAEWIPLYVMPDRWRLALPLAVILTIGLVAVMRPMWRRAVARRDARIQLLTPRTRGERALWVAVSVAAGVAEEVAYRGVLWVLLERWIGSSVLAAVVASIAFGVAHAVQGWRGVVVVTAVALGMHGLARLTGSLLAPILVHVAYDVIAGLTYAALERGRGEATPDWPSPA
jgi:membrane protease YdiL (CAAX protease family)